MLEDIMFLLDKNFGRINNLLKLYRQVNENKKGRIPTYNLDLLRATVVLLHSSLEDYLRNVLSWKLSSASQEVMSKIPLVGNDRKLKFDLGELSLHRGKTLDEILNESICDYLNKQSFNDTRDLAGALKDINLTITPQIENCFQDLQKMIHRRHQIVHQADRVNPLDFSTNKNKRIQSIDFKTVVKWKIAVDEFITQVNRQFYN